MKKSLSLFTILCLFSCAFLSSCGGDDDNEEVDETVKFQKIQEETFQSYKSEIIGTWKPYQVWQSTATKDAGWYPISDIYWDVIYYKFNSDGTGEEENKYKGKKTFTYEIYKNPDYIKYPTFYAPVLMKITYSSELYNNYVVDFGTKGLRLITSILKRVEAPSSGGNAAVVYKKE